MQVQDAQLRQMVSYLETMPSRDKTDQALLENLQALKPTDGVCTVPESFVPQLKGLLGKIGGLPLPQSSADLSGAHSKLNDFESLMILFAVFARLNRQMRHEEAMGALQSRVSQLKVSAATREKGADELKSQALNSLIIGCVAGGLSILGSVLSGIGGLKSAAKLNSLTGGDETKITDAMLKTAESAGSKWNLPGQVMGSSATTLKPGADYASTLGQSQNQRANAEADRQQALASEMEAAQQNDKDIEQDFSDFVRKLMDMLQNMEEARNRAADAAAKA